MEDVWYANLICLRASPHPGNISSFILLLTNKPSLKAESIVISYTYTLCYYYRVKRDRVFLISLDSDETDDIIDVLIKVKCLNVCTTIVYYENCFDYRYRLM